MTQAPTPQDTELTTARTEAARLFTDEVFAGAAGGHFTCGEAEIVARWLRVELGHDAAETWLDGHAYGDDDPDDLHRNRSTAPTITY